MNPNKAIKRWLEACSTAFSKAKAYDYIYPDASTRPEVEYFTYKIMSMDDDDTIPENQNTRTGDTLNRKSSAQWKTEVQIDLHRSEDGMAELARCAMCAKDKNSNIQSIFRRSGVGFVECLGITNETIEQEDRPGLKENYHHRMRCVFNDRLTISFEEKNQVVDAVNIYMADWD